MEKFTSGKILLGSITTLFNFSVVGNLTFHVLVLFQISTGNLIMPFGNKVLPIGESAYNNIRKYFNETAIDELLNNFEFIQIISKKGKYIKNK